jgi:GNAT superfamily N-acetyltransferase
MVVADPASELLGLVRGLGDPAPGDAPEGPRRAAAIIRRRFGLALPRPFVGPPGAEEPVRAATAVDGAAIAAVKWRVFGTTYRGVLPDAFLDRREVVPPVAFWTGRAMVPPSRRHRLLVWGRPGVVHGYLDCGPAHTDGPAPAEQAGDVGEVYELYVDPGAHGLGGGSRLLDAAEGWLAEAGFSTLELSTLAGNGAARRFYEARSWEPTGRTDHVDLGVVAFDEARYRRVGPVAPS